jgi:hypothetical protein
VAVVSRSLRHALLLSLPTVKLTTEQFINFVKSPDAFLPFASRTTLQISLTKTASQELTLPVIPEAPTRALFSRIRHLHLNFEHVIKYSDALERFFSTVLEYASETIEALEVPLSLIEELPQSMPNLKSLHIDVVHVSKTRLPLSAAALANYGGTLRSLTLSGCSNVPRLAHKPNIGVFRLLEEVHIGLVTVPKCNLLTASHLQRCRAVRKAAAPTLNRLFLFDMYPGSYDSDKSDESYDYDDIQATRMGQLRFGLKNQKVDPELLLFAALRCFIGGATFFGIAYEVLSQSAFQTLFSLMRHDPEAFKAVLTYQGDPSDRREAVCSLLFQSPALLADPACIIYALAYRRVVAKKHSWTVYRTDDERAELEERRREERQLYLDALVACGRRGGSEVSKFLISMLFDDFYFLGLSPDVLGSFNSGFFF